jgi:hypothetical protein
MTWKTGELVSTDAERREHALSKLGFGISLSSPMYLHSVRRKRFIYLLSVLFNWSEASVISHSPVAVWSGSVAKSVQTVRLSFIIRLVSTCTSQ